jgi:hypothetical protein
MTSWKAYLKNRGGAWGAGLWMKGLDKRYAHSLH